MPHKQCPSCKTMHGVRKKVCDCGHDFSVKKSTHPLVPEPGGWVVDGVKGMPKLEPSPSLDGSPMSIAKVSQCVAYEGLGYCIYSYIRPEWIADEALRRRWVQAQLAMREVQSYLLEAEHE